MPENRRYPPEQIRYASYIWPGDWQPERTSSTSTPTTTSFHQVQQGERHCACCIRSYFYVTPSPKAFQRHRLVLSRCEQFDPWPLHRHSYSKLISDATSVVLWAIWTNSVYDLSLVYMSVDYFYFLIDWLLWRVYVPTEPFPFAFHPPTKTGPPYSDIVEYFLRRSDGLNCLEGIFADLNCSNRYHTRWKMLQAVRSIFNGQDYYVGYGRGCVCGPEYTSVPLVTCVCLPWPRPREPVVVVRMEETTTWKKKKRSDKKKKKNKKSKDAGCVMM